ncbi:MAG: polysialyltransferase family glycosyltransferase [Candidatus Sigynarchaeota archaeon]
MKKIFITYTPFHILTACGFASEMNDDTEKILLFFKDFPNSDLYHEAIKEWKQNPFRDIVIMDAGMQRDQKSLKQRFRFSRDKLNLMKQYWKNHLKNEPGGYEVYSFNDDTVEAQFLYRKNDHSRNYYMEDGLNSYYINPSEKSIKFYAKLIIRKFLFGFWVERPYPFGSSKHVSTIFSYYPDLVVEPLRKKDLRQISQATFINLGKKGFLDILKKRFNIDEIEDNGPTGIVLFPIFSILAEKKIDMVSFARILMHFFNSQKENFKNIYVKCHPREPESMARKLKEIFPEIKVVRNNIAAEVLFAVIKEKVHHHVLLVSPPTAAFINARIILGDDAEIVCIQNFDKGNLSSKPLYDKLNIQMKII